MAFLGKFYSVAEQIDENLLHPLRVTNDHLRDVIRDKSFHLNILHDCLLFKQLDDVVDKRMNVKKLLLKREFVGLEHCHVDDIFDD